MRVACSALLALAVLSSGCIDLDSEQQVKDLRVLAMKFDPPELQYSFLHILPPEQRAQIPIPLGPYTVTAQALVVDPQGREVTVTQRLCPEEEGDGCPGYKIREDAPPEQIRAIRPFLDPVTLERETDLSLGGELSVPTLSMTFSERAVDYLLPHDVNGEIDLFGVLAFGATPSIVLRAFIPGTIEEEVAFKRFVLSLDLSPDSLDPQLREFLEGFFIAIAGVGFCPPGTDILEDVNCVKNRVPNRNPTLERVVYKIGSNLELTGKTFLEDPTAGGQLQDLVGRVVVAPGTEVRLRPLVGEADREAYQGLNFDIQTRALALKTFSEDLVYTWFTTVGSIDGQTTEQFVPPDATWTVSPDAPDGPAHVWVVVQDQRGGVDWRRLDFEVITPPAPPARGLLEQLGLPSL